MILQKTFREYEKKLWAVTQILLLRFISTNSPNEFTHTVPVHSEILLR